MKTLKIEPSLHQLLRRKAADLECSITHLANRWMKMGAHYDGHIQGENVSTTSLPYASPTATKP
jgi:hypothetical protein